MAKSLRCRDVGVNCDYEAKGKTEDEVLRQAKQHGKEHHGITSFPPELEAKLRGAIKEEPAP